ncbi:YigZ family protein [Xylanibacillus composti]|uniref:IMPACT family member YvyE n=1 Tax=Xylanibacillus composti TaxID=1572762 RepID=A0A8J4M2U5_9BACL|nr:YigZ family protein [Xylanibacillus composti]MDT9724617.1 YigZ family protein [Xylanibacillus composti]GIQ70230.1 IMPACT family member YvyE [Xylanibacillus composti]
MLHAYRTFSQTGEKEIVIKRSRFIGHGAPVETEEEALAFIAAIRKTHAAATHNCFAYMIGERDQIQKFSDDGEPSGTAGKPILEVLKNQKLKNVAVVVTRYFGGIMLGAGGLVRAYTDGAVAASEASVPVEQVLHRLVRIRVDYTWLGKLENELRLRETLLEETLYTDLVTLQCLPREEEHEAFVAWMTDLTQGRGEIELGDPRYVPHPISD